MVPPRKAVEAMSNYTPPLEGRRGKLRLDFNENSIGPPRSVLEVLKNLDPNEISAYPEYSDLNKKSASFFSVPADCIRATNASDEGIMLIVQTYLNPGDKVLLPVPTFAMFKFYTQLAGGEIEDILYTEDLDFPYKEFEKKLEEAPKLAVFVNPNNPTGTVINRDFMINCIKNFPNTMFMVDEAYYEFYKESLVDKINDLENLIILRTFSKSFGMAGLRLGMLISCPENISNLKKVQSPYSISSITVLAALKALEMNHEIEPYINAINKSKELFYKKNKEWKLKAYPSKANFILVKIGEKASEIEQYLKENGILVRNRSSDPLLEGCIRFTMGTEEQTQLLIKHLENALINLEII